MAKSKKSKSKRTKSSSLLKSTPRFSILSLSIFGIIFAVIGGYYLFRTFAASTITSMSIQTPAAESSGMVASRKYPGVYWWHRDGGDATAEKPRDAIYAAKFDENGAPVNVRGSDKFPFNLVEGSKNNNWEDIALDDDNNIWIGDIGANDCGRNNQKLLKVKEPDPASSEKLTILASYTFKFPDPAKGCNTWNSEAMFWLDGKMYIFAKTSNSPVYRVDLPAGSSGTATLTRLGTLAGGVSNISVSSISDDRSRLMVASHEQTRIYKTSNTSLTGDALVKDLISRTPAYSASFDCSCSAKAAVEGGSFKRGSLDIAFVSENKFIYYAKPAGYGDKGGSTNKTDAAAPTVSIASPVANATISGIVTMDVRASDNIGVTRVDIFYDNSGVIREGTAQGKYGWGSAFDTTKISDGAHTINVNAYDAAGNKQSTQITVTVNNGVSAARDISAPSVAITSPSNNSTVSGLITINVTANDNVGLTRVDILYDGSGIIREGFSEGTYGWGSRFDTRKLSNGNHTLSASAYDAAGNKKSSSITIQVKN